MEIKLKRDCEKIFLKILEFEQKFNHFKYKV